MKESLLKRYEDKEIVVKIQSDPRTYIGLCIDVADGVLILNNRKFGLSTFDTRFIVFVQENRAEENKKRRECEELEERQ